MSDEKIEEVVPRPVVDVHWAMWDTNGAVVRWGSSPEVDVPEGATVVDEPVEPPQPTSLFLLSEADQTTAKRNQLLADSDWTQLKDAKVDDQAWAEYRDLLRDLPEQPGFPGNVIWPVPPTNSKR